MVNVNSLTHGLLIFSRLLLKLRVMIIDRLRKRCSYEQVLINFFIQNIFFNLFVAIMGVFAIYNTLESA